MTRALTRRTWIAAAATLTSLRAARAPQILLRSGWQTVNIGDVAHTPGVLHLLAKHVPQAEVTLASTGLGEGVREMLARGFPKLRFIDNLSTAEGSALASAFAEHDLFLHGSGPGLHHQEMAVWQERTGKPSGALGITVPYTSEAASSAINPSNRKVFDRSQFLFTRETDSLANLKKAAVQAPVTGFCPDGTFSFTLRDEAKADAFLKQHQLSGKRFIVLVPRLRLTPYHLIRKVDWPQSEIDRRMSINAKYQEEDAAKLREVAIAWVRKTGGHVLLAPEMSYAVPLLDSLLYQPLPGDVKSKTALRTTFWLPDEAFSTYARAEAVISSECHSPILAAAAGVPCFYLRQPEDGIKGQMYSDLGLSDWAPRIENTSKEDFAESVMAFLDNRDDARKRVRQAAEQARELQAAAVAKVAALLPKT